MKSLPYTPLTPWQAEAFRVYLPYIVAWLSQRDGRTQTQKS